MGVGKGGREGEERVTLKEWGVTSDVGEGIGVEGCRGALRLGEVVGMEGCRGALCLGIGLVVKT